MGINYYLQKNLLSALPNAHSAHIIIKGSLYEDDLVRRMAERGTSFSDAELKAFMALFSQTVCEELKKGYAIKLPFATIKLSVTGIFDGITDTFEGQRHKVRASLSAGPLLKKLLDGVSLEKVIKPVAVPMPLDFIDTRSGMQNAIVSPNGLGSVIGSELRFRFDNPEQGIYFISEDGSKVFKTQQLGSYTNQRLVFMVPDLPGGMHWKLEVRIAYGRSGSIIRSNILPHLLYSE